MASVPLADLSPTVIASYRDERSLEAQPATIRRELSLLRRVVHVARSEWDMPMMDNPLDRVSRPEPPQGRERRLAHGELERLEIALQRTRNRLLGPMVLFAIETAMRRGEILALRWRDISIASRTAHLPLTKNGRARTVPLTDRAIDILSALDRRDERIFPTSETAVRQGWVRLTARAGLTDLHFHDLRHEALSRFAELGLSVPELSVISGHRDPRMLFRYTHIRPAELAKKLALLGPKEPNAREANGKTLKASQGQPAHAGPINKSEGNDDE